MRNIIVNILFVFCCSNAIAQNADKLTESNTDPLYFQIYGGINKSANENLPWSEFSKYPWAGGMFVGVGKEITPLWGWRGTVGFDVNKSRNVQECESPETWSWKDVELFGDVTFDVADALRGNGDKKHKFNLKAFAGVGGLWTFGFPQTIPLSYTDPYSRNSALCVGMHAGLTSTYKVAESISLGAELSHTIVNDRFNGVVADFILDQRTNLSVGLTYYVLNSTRNKKPKVVANGPIIYSNKLRVVPDLPFAIPEQELQKKRQVSGRAFLDFPVNETAINPNYRRNPKELSRIHASVDSAKFDKSIQITRITLHGYASPESPYSNNTRLAKGRTAALMSHLQMKYGFSSALFNTEFTPEDWENLRSYIADNMSVGEGGRRTVKNSIWYDSNNVFETPKVSDEVLQYGKELLAVIDSEMDLDAKEEELKKVGNGAPYRWLYTNVYPGLRHTDYTIEYVVKEYSVADSRKLIYRHPEALSVDEMYRVANSYEMGSDSWYDALIIAAKQYPDDKVANLNAACASIQKRRLKDAKAYLQLVDDDETKKYLHDVIGAMEGTIGWKLVDGKVIRTDEK